MGCPHSHPTASTPPTNPPPPNPSPSRPRRTAQPATLAVVPSSSSRHPLRRSTPLSTPHNLPLRRHPFTPSPPLPLSSLLAHRADFFDTRVTARPEAWRAIRMAVDTLFPPPPAGTPPADDLGLLTAQSILDAAGITIPTGDLVQGVYDEAGGFYALTELVAGDAMGLLPEARAAAGAADSPSPTHTPTPTASAAAAAPATTTEERRASKGKGIASAENEVVVACRPSDRGGPDVRVAIDREADPVEALAVGVEAKLGLERGQVKIAYMGRVLKDGVGLAAQGWREGDVVGGLVFPLQP